MSQECPPVLAAIARFVSSVEAPPPGTAQILEPTSFILHSASFREGYSAFLSLLITADAAGHGLTMTLILWLYEKVWLPLAREFNTKVGKFLRLPLSQQFNHTETLMAALERHAIESRESAQVLFMTEASETDLLFGDLLSLPPTHLRQFFLYWAGSLEKHLWEVVEMHTGGGVEACLVPFTNANCPPLATDLAQLQQLYKLASVVLSKLRKDGEFAATVAMVSVAVDDIGAVNLPKQRVVMLALSNDADKVFASVDIFNLMLHVSARWNASASATLLIGHGSKQPVHRLVNFIVSQHRELRDEAGWGQELAIVDDGFVQAFLKRALFILRLDKQKCLSRARECVGGLIRQQVMMANLAVQATAAKQA